jgi:hypothetical protein
MVNGSRLGALKALKRDFFENVALLCRGKLLRPELAFYMFGFEAFRCWNNTKFWASDASEI